MNNNKQDRITINFRKTSVAEQELYKWIKRHGEIGGDSYFIKKILSEAKAKEERE